MTIVVVMARNNEEESLSDQKMITFKANPHQISKLVIIPITNLGLEGKCDGGDGEWGNEVKSDQIDPYIIPSALSTPLPPHPIAPSLFFIKIYIIYIIDVFFCLLCGLGDKPMWY